MPLFSGSDLSRASIEIVGIFLSRATPVLCECLLRDPGIAEPACRLHRKGTNGVSTNEVTANFMFFDRGTFWVLPLTYFDLPKIARAYPFSPICQNSVLLRRPHECWHHLSATKDIIWLLLLLLIWFIWLLLLVYIYIYTHTYIYIYIYTYIYVYLYKNISLSLSIYIYIYIYTWTYNPHLGLINDPPPLILFFPPNDHFHY